MGRGANAGEPSVPPFAVPGPGQPEFDGPLCAFQVGADSVSGATVSLGGDLHAVHPETRDAGTGTLRDPTLDGATVILDDLEHPASESLAVEGIWCLALGADRIDSAPYFTIWDTEGRIRTWLILPPLRQMIGIAHHWLPRVPLRKDPAGRRRGPISPPSDGSEMADTSLQIRKIRRCRFSGTRYLKDENQKIFRYPRGRIHQICRLRG
jgi:hypothetical protein